jgi:hypothetical protein
MENMAFAREYGFHPCTPPSVSAGYLTSLGLLRDVGSVQLNLVESGSGRECGFRRRRPLVFWVGCRISLGCCVRLDEVVGR